MVLCMLAFLFQAIVYYSLLLVSEPYYDKVVFMQFKVYIV